MKDGRFIIKVGHASTDPCKYTNGRGEIVTSQIISNDYRRRVAKSGLSALQWADIAESSPEFREIAQKIGCTPLCVAISKIMADDPALCHGMPHDYKYLLEYHLGDVKSMVETYYSVWNETPPDTDSQPETLSMSRSLVDMDRLTMGLIAIGDPAAAEIRHATGCGMIAAVIAEELVNETNPAHTREDVIAFVKSHMVELKALEEEWRKTAK